MGLAVRGWLCLGMALCTSMAGAADDPLAALKAGRPKAVAALIERIAYCNHWADEEPYDAARRQEIAAAMTSLRCEHVHKDEAAARKRYAQNRAALDALDQARRWSN